MLKNVGWNSHIYSLQVQHNIYETLTHGGWNWDLSRYHSRRIWTDTYLREEKEASYSEGSVFSMVMRLVRGRGGDMNLQRRLRKKNTVISPWIYLYILSILDNELQRSRSAKETMDNLPWRRRPRLRRRRQVNYYMTANVCSHVVLLLLLWSFINVMFIVVMLVHQSLHYTLHLSLIIWIFRNIFRDLTCQWLWVFALSVILFTTTLQQSISFKWKTFPRFCNMI